MGELIKKNMRVEKRMKKKMLKRGKEGDGRRENEQMVSEKLEDKE